eukprot:GILI01017460.1.p1 GENE.GILI01017460.1~~GILI01017460.1.p1  ORF type:complete len:665 (-),score=61.15 GILI01017460.1:57-1988(-)
MSDNNDTSPSKANAKSNSSPPTPTRHLSRLQEIHHRQELELKSEENKFHAALRKVKHENNSFKNPQQCDQKSLNPAALREPAGSASFGDSCTSTHFQPYGDSDEEKMDSSPTPQRQKSGLFTVLTTAKKSSQGHSTTKQKLGSSGAAHLHYLTPRHSRISKLHNGAHSHTNHNNLQEHDESDQEPNGIFDALERRNLSTTVAPSNLRKNSSLRLSQNETDLKSEEDDEGHQPCPPSRSHSRIVDSVHHASIFSSLPLLSCFRKKSRDSDEEVVEPKLRHGVAFTGLDTEGLPWRERLAGFIHTKEVQVILVVLLLLDVCLVIAELVLQSHNVCELTVKWEDCIEPPAGAFPLVEEEVSNSSGFFAPTGCGVAGKPVMPHGIHTAEIVLVWVSRSILFVFFIEIIVLMVCLGRQFFTILYTLDFIIVGTSLILSFIFDGNSKIESETALLIVLRCWRFARVLHGFGITVHNVSTDEISGNHHHGHDSPQSTTEGTETDKGVLMELKEGGEALPSCHTGAGATSNGSESSVGANHIVNASSESNGTVEIKVKTTPSHTNTDQGKNAETEDALAYTAQGGHTLAKHSLARMKTLRHNHRQELVHYCRWLEEEVSHLKDLTGGPEPQAQTDRSGSPREVLITETVIR